MTTKRKGGVALPPKLHPTLTAPAGAHHWTLWRLESRQVKNTETGKSRWQTFQERMRGDAGPDGVVAEAWPTSEFKPQHVLARWGAGRYRVDWYSVKNERLDGEIFELAEQPSSRMGASRVAPQGAEVEQGAAAAAQGGFPMDPWSLMQWVEAQREASAERERQRADAQRERDRDFFQQMQAQQAASTHTLLTMLGTKAAAPAADAGLAQREIALAMGEMGLKFEKRIAAAIEELGAGGGGGEGDDDTPPAASLEEAGQRIGMKVLKELEDKAPEMLEDAIPMVVGWLKKKGFTPSEELEDELAAVRARKAKTG